MIVKDNLVKHKIVLNDRVKASPRLTGLENWIEGEVIDIEKNPFIGEVISIKDDLGRIFFGKKEYFRFL